LGEEAMKRRGGDLARGRKNLRKKSEKSDKVTKKTYGSKASPSEAEQGKGEGATWRGGDYEIW